MNKIYVGSAIILMLTLVPGLYACVKGISFFATLENQNLESGIVQFASRVESQELTHQEISIRLQKMASAENQISEGFGSLKIALYFFLVAICAITILQGYILHWLFKSHNKLNQSGTPRSAAPV